MLSHLEANCLAQQAGLHIGDNLEELNGVKHSFSTDFLRVQFASHDIRFAVSRNQSRYYYHLADEPELNHDEWAMPFLQVSGDSKEWQWHNKITSHLGDVVVVSVSPQNSVATTSATDARVSVTATKQPDNSIMLVATLSATNAKPVEARATVLVDQKAHLEVIPGKAQMFHKTARGFDSSVFPSSEDPDTILSHELHLGDLKGGYDSGISMVFKFKVVADQPVK